MWMGKEKISIVTVCYNAENTVANTLESVLRQTYRPLECIVIDGGSSDRTYEIVKSYAEEMKATSITIKTISEEDKGIYNAMNKGIKCADGEWIAFMNADDTYSDDTSIERLIKDVNIETDVIFGNEVVKINDKKKINRHSDFKEIMPKRLGFCHQAALVRTRYMKEYLFDETYLITADYNFFLKLFLAGRNFRYVDVDVADYSSSGTSAVYYKKAINETFRVKVENGLLNPYNPKEEMKRLFWILYTTIRKGQRISMD